jgi:hypothetical protein
MVQALTLLQGAFAAAGVIGLVVRGRLRLGWSFAVYLSAIAIFDTLIGLWPEQFLTWPVWLFSEVTYAFLVVILHFLHKTILMALTPYMLVFTVILQALETHGWTGSSDASYLNMLAFLAVLGCCLIATWRPGEQGDVHPSVAKTVQPWA